MKVEESIPECLERVSDIFTIPSSVWILVMLCRKQEDMMKRIATLFEGNFKLWFV